jgi:hypothetical protein
MPLGMVTQSLTAVSVSEYILHKSLTAMCALKAVQQCHLHCVLSLSPVVLVVFDKAILSDHSPISKSPKTVAVLYSGSSNSSNLHLILGEFSLFVLLKQPMQRMSDKNWRLEKKFC